MLCQSKNLSDIPSVLTDLIDKFEKAERIGPSLEWLTIQAVFDVFKLISVAQINSWGKG